MARTLNLSFARRRGREDRLRESLDRVLGRQRKAMADSSKRRPRHSSGNRACGDSHCGDGDQQIAVATRQDRRPLGRWCPVTSFRRTRGCPATQEHDLLWRDAEGGAETPPPMRRVRGRGTLRAAPSHGLRVMLAAQPT